MQAPAPPPDHIHPSSVLVTGATGFIGRAVVPCLLQRGIAVRALVRQGRPCPLSPDPRLHVLRGDLRDAPSLRAALAGAQAVVHLAAAKADEPESEAVNVQGARQLAEACRAQGVLDFINVSTQSARLRRQGRYGATKAAADALLHRSGLRVTTLRLSLVYGDGESGVFGSILRYARLPLVPVLGSGAARFRPIHRDDVARAVAAALSLPATRGKIYDVGGPDQISLKEVILQVLQHLGLHRSLVHLPLGPALWLATALSLLPRPPLTRSNVLGAAEDLPFDPAPFFTDLGFVPRPFAQGLAQVLGPPASA